MSNDEEKIIRYARIGVSEKTKGFPILKFLEFPLCDLFEEESSQDIVSLCGQKDLFLKKFIQENKKIATNCVMIQLLEKKFINIDGETFQSESKALSKIIMFGELMSERETLLKLGSNSLVYFNMTTLALKQAIRLKTLGGVKSIYLPFDPEKQEIHYV